LHAWVLVIESCYERGRFASEVDLEMNGSLWKHSGHSRLKNIPDETCSVFLEHSSLETSRNNEIDLSCTGMGVGEVDATCADKSDCHCDAVTDHRWEIAS